MIALVLAAVLAQPAYYTHDEAQALFTTANDDFYKGQYDKAREGYLKLLDHGLVNADVLFNLGTTCLQNGKLGEAVLYLERAKQLERGDDIDANLAYAHSLIVDKVVGAPSDEPFLERLARATQGNAVTIAFLICWWAFFGMLLLWRLSSKRLLLGFAVAGLFLAAALTGGLTAVQVWEARNVTEAVVMAPTAKVLEFPGDAAKVAFEIHSGLKVRLMEDAGKFVRVRLPNGLEGWTDKSAVVGL